MSEASYRDRVQTRLGRRRLLKGAGIGGAGLAAAWTLGCSSGKTQTGGTSSAGSASNAAGQPKRGGVLNYAGGFAGSRDTLGGGFDPDTQLGFAVRGYTLFYERLVAYNLRTYALEPELAQKWEQPAQTEYLFHLQPNVKWQNKPPVNGRLMTTDDVLYSLERARTNDPLFVSRSLMSQVDKIEAPDKTTIRVTAKAPDAGTLTKLAADNMAILAKETVAKDPKLSSADSVVGTGAFIMKSVETSVAGDYVRNPDYWKPGLPYLDELRTRHFGDLQTAWAAFLAGQVDVALIPGQEVPAYTSSQGAGYKPDWYADDTIGLALRPNVKAKPMNDQRVTQALKLLIDHDEQIKAWTNVQFGKGGNGSILPAAYTAWDLSDDEYRQHLEWKQPKDDAAKQATAMLSAAGYTPSSPLKFELIGSPTPQNNPGIELIQAQWKKWSQGAVDATIRLIDTPTRSKLEASGNFTYTTSGGSVGMVEPDIWLTAFLRSDGSQNRMGFADPQVDTMIDKQRITFNLNDRKAIIKQLILYMIDHGPTTIPAQRFFLYAAKPKVQNRQPEYFLNGRQYQSVWFSA